jgi:hypothetical protein
VNQNTRAYFNDWGEGCEIILYNTLHNSKMRIGFNITASNRKVDITYYADKDSSTYTRTYALVPTS